MGVARDHQPDRRIEPLEDRQYVTAQSGAALVIEPPGQRAALVDQQHDRLHPGGFQPRHERVGSVRFIGELHPRHSRWGDQGRGRLERHADEADPHPADRLDRGRGENGSAIGVDNIGGEVGEFRPRERFEPARLARSRVDLDAAAGLHPLQFGDAFIEFVIADRRQFEPSHVERGDRRFVEEQGRADRTRPNQITCRYCHAIGGAALLERGRKIGRAARRDCAIGGGNGQLGRLEIAVEIVDREDLHLDPPERRALHRGAGGEKNGRQDDGKAAHYNLIKDCREP